MRRITGFLLVSAFFETRTRAERSRSWNESVSSPGCSADSGCLHVSLRLAASDRACSRRDLSFSSSCKGFSWQCIRVKNTAGRSCPAHAAALQSAQKQGQAMRGHLRNSALGPRRGLRFLGPNRELLQLPVARSLQLTFAKLGVRSLRLPACLRRWP